MAIAPLNLPGYAAPQTLDFSSLANLGQVYKKAQAERGIQDAFSNGVPTDAAGLAQLGAQVGAYNPQLGLSLAQLGMTAGQRQQEQERQAKQDTRQTERDKVTDAQNAAYLQIARQNAARAGEDKPLIKDVTDANGNTVFYRINPRTGEATALSPSGAPPATGGNPFGSGKFNEGQGKAAGFTDRMLQSEAILSGKAPETGIGPVTPGTDTQGANLVEYGISNTPYVPDVAKNKLHSKEYQQFDQAKRDFVNAQLRRESGAAISPSEFDSANKQYFPVPGDSPEVIAQKRANRRVAVEAMGREGGQAYRPKAVFREDGAVASTNPNIAPAQSPGGAPPPPKPGQLVDGYRFKGGNPADPNSWVQAQ